MPHSTTTTTTTPVDDDGTTPRLDFHALSTAKAREYIKNNLVGPNTGLGKVTGDLFDNVTQDHHIQGNLYNLFSIPLSKKASTTAFVLESSDHQTQTHAPEPDTVTYGEFAQRVDKMADLLFSRMPKEYQDNPNSSNLERPRIVSLMAPNVEFFVVAFAIQKIGCTLVILDPTMEKYKLQHCIQIANLTMLVTNLSGLAWNAVCLKYPFLRRVPKVVKLNAKISPTTTPSSFKNLVPEPIQVDGAADMLMTFTTGTTGLPKKIIKSHNFIKSQLSSLAEALSRRRTSSKLTTPTPQIRGLSVFTNLPTFILCFLYLGSKVLLPSTFDITKMNPVSLLKAMKRAETQMFAGSPSCGLKLARHCIATNQKWDIQSCILGGAPVFKFELETLMKSTDGQVLIVYGSSEAEPISLISAEERMDRENSKSLDGVSYAVCGGYTDYVTGSSVRIASLQANVFLGVGEVGEITVSGPQVHTVHPDRIIYEEKMGGMYLRTGDAGFIDSNGLLWLLGRVDFVFRESPDSTPLYTFPTSVERMLLDRFHPLVTYVVYLTHAEKGGLLFLEAPMGMSAEDRGKVLELVGELRVPVHELHVSRKVPRDKRHGSKPNTAKIFKGLSGRRADEEVEYKIRDDTPLSSIASSLKQAKAPLPTPPPPQSTLADLLEVPSLSTPSAIFKQGTDKPLILFSNASLETFKTHGGGKAANMARLDRIIDDIASKFPNSTASVPKFFCVGRESLHTFLDFNNSMHLSTPSSNLASLPSGETRTAALESFFTQIEKAIMEGTLPPQLSDSLTQILQDPNHVDPHSFLAVRSSGADEDAAAHSFAGQFESFMFVKPTLKSVEEALKKCWISAFAPRVMSHRLDCGLPINNLGMGMAVVVQEMVDSVSAGVAFSRHPLKPVSVDAVLVESVWGQGEALVSGLVEPDSFEVARVSGGKVLESTVVEKPIRLTRDPEASLGLIETPVEKHKQKEPSLTPSQCAEIAHLALGLETQMGLPIDMEFAYTPSSQLRCVQVRPVVTLPNSLFFQKKNSPQGMEPILWDNSNIVESYSGVTTPLTFSFASEAYAAAYRSLMINMKVPEDIVKRQEGAVTNMLGLIRGHIYYNLMNWYRLLSCIPMAQFGDPRHMETMMGVKQGQDALAGDVKETMDKIMKERPEYKKTLEIGLQVKLAKSFFTIDKIVQDFFDHFNPIYNKYRKEDFRSLSFFEQMNIYDMFFEEIINKWQAPLLNDTLVMACFGTLKKMTEQYILREGDAEANLSVEGLQNDLLCGEGGVESAEPTKLLMKLAGEVDSDEGSREWFLKSKEDVIESLKRLGRCRKDMFVLVPVEAKRLMKLGGEQLVEEVKVVRILQRFAEFLDRFGFRCANELKLEESDLYETPDFLVDSVAGYVKTKSYSLEDMETREKQIRHKAELLVKERLQGSKLRLYQWVLKNTRKVVKHRENMRFARTKLWGVVRYLIRAMGHNLFNLNLIAEPMDVFYLSVQELKAFRDGRSVSVDFKTLISSRKVEFEEYRNAIPPPERFVTHGAVGAWLAHPQVLQDLDLLKEVEAEGMSDPKILKGVSCCPGVVEGVVKVVKNISEAKGIDKEILVTARTDPGWVPLYPLCSGLLIERGSLLSHSAVVARELGLPTIVGISGGLMTRLKTGMRVRVDASKGVVHILDDIEGADA
ncbi:hypothetical protein HDV05_008719 [Chytridiales sp. JEL 0842]|nr:hypothetical protein HDV05_008719 [Chytridiales sp. JEL 0842]